MKKLTEVISRELEAAMRSGAFEVADVVARIREAEPDVVAGEGDRLLDAALGRRIKDLLRDFEDDEESEDGRLFGLPRALAFETPEGIRYIDTDQARWEHLKGAVAIRTANVTRAERRLNALERTMARVEGAMSADPTLTLGEAASRIEDAAA